MGSGTAVLVGLRSLVVLIAMAVIGLGAWALNTINDIEARGSSVLDASPLSADQKSQWQDFFDGANRTEYRIWIAIATGCFTFLTTTYIFLSHKLPRLTTTPYILLPLELLTTLTMATTFAFTLSSTLRLQPLCQSLVPSPTLSSFSTLCPLSAPYTITSGLGTFLLTITTLSTLIILIRRHSKSQSCSFEPTASSLGMSHGYQAVVPPPARSTIPTLYDPRKPIPGTPARPLREDEMGFRFGLDVEKEVGKNGRRDSGMSEGSVEIGDADEKEISGPLSLERPERVAQMRPARPWSEAPKRKG